MTRRETTLGKCNLFGEINIISGEVEYDYASLVRMSESKCGNKGKYFQDKT
jgi:hypothetical protein